MKEKVYTIRIVASSSGAEDITDATIEAALLDKFDYIGFAMDITTQKDEEI